MPDMRFQAKTATRTEIPRPKRGEGTVGARLHRAAEQERAVQEGRRPAQRPRPHPEHLLQARLRLDRPRRPARPFRWMGLYTQRAPGFDGGKTAMLEEEELDDDCFMMRVRSDGRLLSRHRAGAGRVGSDFARDTADVTDRENIQYHWIRIEDVPAIWARLDAAGLDTTEACGDSPRPFLGSPVAGVAADEIIDDTPALEEIKRRYIGDPEFANLPRKFKTAVTGHPSHDVAPEVNDVAFVGTVHPEHGPGFDLWVGGGLSTNPMLAQARRLDPAGGGRGRLGRRDLDLPRLRLPPAALQGPAEVPRRRLGRGEVPRGARERVPRPRARLDSPASPAGLRDHIGVHEQKDGRGTSASRRSPAGSPGPCWCSWPTWSSEYGAPGARLTPYQKIVLIGVAPSRSRRCSPASTRSACRLGRQLAAQHDGVHRHRVLQAGDRRHQGARPRPGRRAGAALPRPRHPITVNVNGCPNACARTQVADIGLKGQLVSTTASRSRASRCTSAARPGCRPTSAASCAPTRSPAPDSTTTSPRGLELPRRP